MQSACSEIVSMSECQPHSKLEVNAVSEMSKVSS